jgi:hypothetical protein
VFLPPFVMFVTVRRRGTVLLLTSRKADSYRHPKGVQF